ncbi:hypothetical protein GCM10010191_45740 [Actinomadura vinacea]|uniref:Uncharacterized protein n=1 Tax=Actinomadura vinacea TaxID=115336 RepID=A0ABP5WL57_9ACTN
MERFSAADVTIKVLDLTAQANAVPCSAAVIWSADYPLLSHGFGPTRTPWSRSPAR